MKVSCRTPASGVVRQLAHLRTDRPTDRVSVLFQLDKDNAKAQLLIFSLPFLCFLSIIKTPIASTCFIMNLVTFHLAFIYFQEIALLKGQMISPTLCADFAWVLSCILHCPRNVWYRPRVQQGLGVICSPGGRGPGPAVHQAERGGFRASRKEGCSRCSLQEGAQRALFLLVSGK